MSWLFRCDIFISYSHADEEWVEQLERDLATEFRVCRDRQMLGGDEWLEWIKKTLESSRGGIVVLSPEALKSVMVLYELITLYNRGVLIPVLYRDVAEMPEPLTRINYIDFRDRAPDARQKSLDKLRATLRSKVPPPRTFLRLPLWAVFLMLMMLVSTLVIAKAGYEYSQSSSSIAFLRRTQRQIQSIETRLASFVDRTGAMPQGERRHADPSTGEHLITDVWERGRLAYRYFYQAGRPVARDEFIYEGLTVVGKVRSYMDDEQRVFLKDHFTQDGNLTEKLYCPRGINQPCDPRVDDMRSPLPPPSLLVYR